MKTKVIAIVGSKSSGKTTTIENLIKVLSERGYKVAAVKHISELNFTIDTKGKDTWKFAQSGAKTIVSVASHEIATIEKIDKENFSLEKILKKCEGNDIVFLEGFRALVSKEKTIPKIVVVKTQEEALNAQALFNPILVFAGPFSTEKLNLKIPYVNALKNPEKIADIIEKAIKA